MSDLASSHSTALPLVLLARQLVQSFPQKDKRGEVEALFDYVQHHIRYVRDPVGAEWLQAPLATVELRAGDCDDKSILLASLLNAIGYKTRFRAVGAVPGRLSHVMVEVLLDGAWLGLDPTEPHEMGWTPTGADELLSEVSGLGFGVSSIAKSVSKAVKSGGKKITGAVKKAVKVPVKTPVKSAPSLKTLTSSLKKVLTTPVNVTGQLTAPVVEKTIGSEEFQKYFPEAVKLIPVVGEPVGTAIQAGQSYSASKAFAESVAEQEAAEKAAAQAAEAALKNIRASSGPSPLLVFGLAAATAFAVFALSRKGPK